MTTNSADEQHRARLALPQLPLGPSAELTDRAAEGWERFLHSAGKGAEASDE
ncbi:hypothetical protein [Streptomyces sp. ISL-94]|uniref:hypothetical protein n=1 Tax=Streptomyces sp. ISL-94 TaxID=2819190 RepID=UPI001BE59953|nr:hypothetical protein [Streptomyces sp. ISL-94]MBT2479302.1 hypothetical protein [Streptomyces sp. ISL-94]